MKVVTTALDGVLIIEPDVFKDERGYFFETFNRKRYAEAGIDRVFVQDNLSFSTRGALRGLHFQIKNPQAKLVHVVQGEVFDVAVDIRKGSPTFGKWTGIHLSDENKVQFFIPEGFAHGFAVLSGTALFMYKCSAPYDRADEGGIIWSDEGIAIDWPVTDPVISEKDQRYPPLAALGPDQLPQCGGGAPCGSH